MEIKQDRFLNGSEAFKLAMQAAHELSDFCNLRVTVQGNYSIIYAKEDDLPIGCLIFLFVDEACLMTLAYVVQGYRKRGIFKAMFCHLKEYCQKNGIKNIEWGCHVSNGLASAAYNAMGFEPAYYGYYVPVKDPL